MSCRSTIGIPVVTVNLNGKISGYILPKPQAFAPISCTSCRALTIDRSPTSWLPACRPQCINLPKLDWPELLVVVTSLGVFQLVDLLTQATDFVTHLGYQIAEFLALASVRVTFPRCSWPSWSGGSWVVGSLRTTQPRRIFFLSHLVALIGKSFLFAANQLFDLSSDVKFPCIPERL